MLQADIRGCTRGSEHYLALIAAHKGVRPSLEKLDATQGDHPGSWIQGTQGNTKIRVLLVKSTSVSLSPHHGL